MTKNDIPDKTIIRHLTQEKKKLSSEVEYLKGVIRKRDLAIAEFKKWQAKVAKYKWEYWLSEGVKLLDEAPDESLRKALASLLGRERIFDEWKKKIDRAYKSYEKAQKKFSDKISEL